MEAMWIIKVKHSTQDLVVNTGHVNNNCKQSLETSRNAIHGSPDWVQWAKWRKTGNVPEPTLVLLASSARGSKPHWPGQWCGVCPHRPPLRPSQRVQLGCPTCFLADNGWAASPPAGMGSNPMTQNCLSTSATSLPEAKYNHPFPNSKKFQSDAVRSDSRPKSISPAQPSPQPKITGLVWAGELFFSPNVGTLFGVIFVLILSFGSKQRNWRSRYINIPHQAHGLSSSLGRSWLQKYSSFKSLQSPTQRESLASASRSHSIQQCLLPGHGHTEAHHQAAFSPQSSWSGWSN